MLISFCYRINNQKIASASCSIIYIIANQERTFNKKIYLNIIKNYYRYYPL